MLTDAECDEILAEMAKRGEFATRECVRFVAEYLEAAMSANDHLGAVEDKGITVHLSPYCYDCGRPQTETDSIQVRRTVKLGMKTYGDGLVYARVHITCDAKIPKT